MDKGEYSIKLNSLEQKETEALVLYMENGKYSSYEMYEGFYRADGITIAMDAGSAVLMPSESAHNEAVPQLKPSKVLNLHELESLNAYLN